VVGWRQFEQGREIWQQAQAFGRPPEAEPDQAAGPHHPACLRQGVLASLPDPVKAGRHVEAVVIKGQREHVADPEISRRGTCTRDGDQCLGSIQPRHLGPPASGHVRCITRAAGDVQQPGLRANPEPVKQRVVDPPRSLAGSLNDQSFWLSDLGRREEALAAAQEAVTIFRQLAQARPDAFLGGLARLLNTQSGRLSDLGRREEALAAAEEAVTICRQLARIRPAGDLPGLARSLNTPSFCLSDLGRLEEALAASEEAADIFRHLAEAVPDVFLPFLATSLTNLANMLSELNRDAEASAIRDEANATVRVLTRLREERVNDQATAQPSDP
jgi:tetratricopeptide (TPR) repeat protein